MDTIRRIKNKYYSMPAALKASVWFTVCNILQRGISVITTPIFTRLLTTEQYGVYTIYTSWYSIVSIFTTLYLFANVYAKGLIEFEEDRDRFTSSLIGLYSLSTCVCFCIYIIFQNSFNALFKLPQVCVFAMFAECLFYPAYSFWCTKQRVDYKYKAVIAFTLAMAVVSPILGIISIRATEYKAEARIISFVFVQVIMGLLMYINLVKKGKTLFSKKYWIHALKFNLPLIPHYLSLVVLQQSDRIMIGSLVSKSAASIYSVAYLVAQMLTLVTNAINYSYIPFAYRSMRDRAYESLGRRIIQLLSLVSVALAVIMTVGPEIIHIVAAPEYAEAFWIIPPVAAATFFQYMYDLFTVVEYHYNKTFFVMGVSVFSALMNIVLNYIFIPVYGYRAAAYTTLFCYVLTGSLHYVFSTYVYKKETGNKSLVAAIKILVLSLIPIVTMVVMLELYHSLHARYIIMILGIIALIALRKKVINAVRNIV